MGEVFFQGSAEIATLTNTFSVAGVPTDPSTVSCVITDPTGTAITHSYQGTAPADITKVSTGEYQLQVPCSTAGLWSYVWIGTGSASDVQAGTWTVNPVSLIRYYTSVEELQERLGITDITKYQLSAERAVRAAATFINGYCGRHFWQVTESRTYMPYSIYELPIDDVVSITEFALDYNGDGNYSVIWDTTQYELSVGLDEFNQLPSGELRPYTHVRVTNLAGNGQFFPFIWPFSRLDRVKITGTWGWPAVPEGISQASLQLAVDLFKLKDAPFGVAGSPDWGAIRVGATPLAISMLSPYISPKRKVGV